MKSARPGPHEVTHKLSFEQQLLLFGGVVAAGAALATMAWGVLWLYDVRRPEDNGLLPQLGGAIGGFAFVAFAVWYNAGAAWGIVAAVAEAIFIVVGALGLAKRH